MSEINRSKFLEKKFHPSKPERPFN